MKGIIKLKGKIKKWKIIQSYRKLYKDDRNKVFYDKSLI